MKALRQIDERQQIIIVEVKCFPESTPQREEFYRALGQYIVYYHALAEKGEENMLYLAIPANVYGTLFQQNIIKKSAQAVKVHLMVCDLDKEEIVEWVR